MDKEEWKEFKLFKRPEPVGTFEEETRRRKREGVKFCFLCGREVKLSNFLKGVKAVGNLKIKCRCGGYVSFGKEEENE